MASKPVLSIIILSYNVKDLLLQCLDSLYSNKTTSDHWQVIVVDNASTDDSTDTVKTKFPTVEIIKNDRNLGFSAGNNVGVKKATGEYVLFLNPDTKIIGQAIQKTLQFIKECPEVGAITCRVELPDGSLDYSSHRGFPSPWNSLAYFSGLSKLFPRLKLFSGYSATYLNTKTTHEIDCLTGAFMLVRKKAGDQVKWWDEDYFWNGEDIEFCFCLKEKGWKIIFFPDEKIIHYKGSSSGLWKTAKVTVNKETRLNAAKSGTKAMKIFYLKHYYKKYPPGVRDFILFGILLLEKYRLLKINLS